MSTAFSTPPTPFSFDQIASEVNTIVEDLRWLHLEMSLRNYSNELVFRGVVTSDTFLRQAFAGLREKLGAFEVTVYANTRLGVASVFRDVDDLAPWKTDHTPWMETVDNWFSRTSVQENYSQPELTHCLSGRMAITAITSGIAVHNEITAVIVIIAPASNVIPRLKKLLVGLSNTVGLCLHFLAKRPFPPDEEPEEILFPPVLTGPELDDPVFPSLSMEQDARLIESDASAADVEIFTSTDRVREHYTRLSKQYRFLMKYAPFPIIHLDEDEDRILNANPSFERIIGTDRWDALHLSDLAVLEILPGFGDTLPCVLHVLSDSGITVTYRGIMTRIHMYQSTIREITLDLM